MKRILVFLISAALVAGALYAVPVAAQEAPAVPEVPNIEDPAGDANFLNSGTAAPLGEDNVTGEDASSLADLMKIWFTNDDKNVSVHFLTEAALPGGNAVTFQAFASPGEGEAGESTVGCLRFVGLIPGTNPGGGSYQGDPFIRLLDRCNVGTSVFDDSVEGEFKTEALADETGITTLTFPRSYSPLLGNGSVLSTPTATSHSPTVGHSEIGFATPTTDNTKPGTDFVVSSGSKKAKKTPPGKNDPPGKKKGCKKGKGKKRGCEGKGKKSPKKGKPKSAGCATFKPGEAGAGKPTVILTDAATEEKPVEQATTLEQSTADVEGEPSFDYFNVVVDSKAASAGLYATFEFPTARDYDLDLLHTDGSYAARSHGFNPVGPLYGAPPFQGTEGHGGKTTASSESLVGIKTNDCGGWTIQTANWLGEGGEFTVKLWLGEAQIDPQAPGEETP